MHWAKITAITLLGAGLLIGSLAAAQTYNPYSYQYPTTQYQYPQTQYQYPQYGVCPNLYSNLTVGSWGTQVSELQRFLMSRYGDTRLTGGYYGTLTAYYVAQFQRSNGIAATGGVGPQTRAAIARTCGGNPYPGPVPAPYPSVSTFRLDKSFTLDVGESAKEYRGNLTVTLTQVGGGYIWPYYSSNDDSVRVTLAYSCTPGTYCIYAPQQSYTLEEDDSVDFMGYEVTVTNVGSNRATFRVENDNNDDDDDDDARINITDPTANEDFEQGDEMRIAWSVSDEPNNASVILDLYDEDDDRIGTIAIEDGETGTYEWDIPHGGGFCTQQYPNGLCGWDLEGDYYIKARLVQGNGFSSGFQYDTDDSGVFTIED